MNNHFLMHLLPSCLFSSWNLSACTAVAAPGNIYVSDEGNSRIRKITPTGDVSTFAGQEAPPGSLLSKSSCPT